MRLFKPCGPENKISSYKHSFDLTWRWTLYLILIFLAAACNRYDDGAPTPTPTILPADTRTPVPLPDLIILSMNFEPRVETSCFNLKTDLGTRIVIYNQGSALSGPFVVGLNNQQQIVEAGLASGESTVAWFAGYALQNSAYADITQQVEESDEINNQLNQPFILPTQSPLCNPTPANPVLNSSPAQFLRGIPPGFGVWIFPRMVACLPRVRWIIPSASGKSTINHCSARC